MTTVVQKKASSYSLAITREIRNVIGTEEELSSDPHIYEKNTLNRRSHRYSRTSNCASIALTNRPQVTASMFSALLKILSSQKRGGYRGVPFDLS